MPCTVIVDSREYRTAEEVVKNLRRLGATVIERTLDVGDYIASQRVIIERKTANDFASSITDGRLFEQAKKLVDACEKPIIIVEGSIWSITKYRKIHIHAILGALTTLTIRFNIQVLFSRDPETTAYYIYEIAKLEQEREKKGVKTVCMKKTQSIRELQIQFLSSLPGIGRKRAEKILEEFGNPLNALNNFRLWSRVGVPENVIAEIRKVLTLDYHSAGEANLEKQTSIEEVLSSGSSEVKAREMESSLPGILKYLSSQEKTCSSPEQDSSR